MVGTFYNDGAVISVLKDDWAHKTKNSLSSIIYNWQSGILLYDFASL